MHSPLGNHVTQQKLTETTENRSALAKTPNFVIFRFILVYSALFGCHAGVISARSGIFRHHSCPFRFIPVLFRLIPAFVPFQCLVTLATSGILSNLSTCYATLFQKRG